MTKKIKESYLLKSIKILNDFFEGDDLGITTWLYNNYPVMNNSKILYQAVKQLKIKQKKYLSKIKNVKITIENNSKPVKPIKQSLSP